MRFKIIFLTLLFVTGFSFQNCLNDDCNCPPHLGDYFDIQGIELRNLKKNGDCCSQNIPENEEVRYSDYRGLSLNYIVEYHSNNCIHQKSWGFSLINSALACSCLENGWEGSEEEKLNALTIITLNDFDDFNLANDTINKLFDVNIHNETIDLNQYLHQDTSLIRYEGLGLRLKKAPKLDNEFKVKVIMELSTNEVYESESAPIRIVN